MLREREETINQARTRDTPRVKKDLTRPTRTKSHPNFREEQELGRHTLDPQALAMIELGTHPSRSQDLSLSFFIGTRRPKQTNLLKAFGP